MPLPQYKISFKSTYRFKRFTHLRSLKVSHYGIVEATRLRNMASRSPSMSSPPYKISSKPINQFKVIRGLLCTHLRSLNVCNFGMVEGTGLENMASRSSLCHQLNTKFQPNPPIISKVAPLRNLNFRHFGMVEAMGLNSTELRSSSMSSPPYKFHPNSPISSKLHPPQ
jgi:hypothetical protein